MAIPTLGAMIAAMGSPAEWGAIDTSLLYWDNANGRLGIGEPSPGFLLHIRKDVDSGLGPTLCLQNSTYTNSNGAYSALRFQHINSARYSELRGYAFGGYGQPFKMTLGLTDSGDNYREVKQWDVIGGTKTRGYAASNYCSGFMNVFQKNYYEGSSNSAINLLRQFTDITNWGASGYLIEIFIIGPYNTYIAYGSFFAKWAYSDQVIVNTISNNFGFTAPYWNGKTQISGNYYRQDCNIATPAYNTYFIRISSPTDVTYDSVSAQSNCVYYFNW